MVLSGQAAVRAIFDAKYYLRRYPDIAEAGVDPLAHFLSTGWAEGRNPCALFDTELYLERNPDVALVGMNPLVHYVRHGAREGRTASLLFDSERYLRKYPDVAASGANPLAHYVKHGWREGREGNPLFDQDWYVRRYSDAVGAAPCPLAHFAERALDEGLSPHPLFDTAFYLDRYPDVIATGMNPLAHYMLFGHSERRTPHPDYETEWYVREQIDAASGPRPRLAPLVKLDTAPAPSAPSGPLVSVIVPNYNHARFLPQRLDSIYGQTYANIEVILLDDASTDDSLSVLESYRARYPDKTRLIRNERNSGAVFSQWQKGIEAARGELVWICESDDFADFDFLARLTPFFLDDSVMISFGRVQFANAEGEPQEGLDHYREAAEPGIWRAALVRCANAWFTSGFAVSNLIPNVGGCLIRRQELSEEVWRAALSFKVLGDWFLYVHFAGGGRIAYSPHAVSYFRQHGANTSVVSFQSPHYYEEHERIARLLRERWQTPTPVLRRLSANVESQYARVGAKNFVGPLKTHFSLGRIANASSSKPHILMALLGFELGGGEIFPINLANALVKQGYFVSALTLSSRHEDPTIRKRLDARVAVYRSEFVSQMGAPEFLRSAGVNLIHSHNLGIEYFFHVNQTQPIEIPYLVTLHGSYECASIARDALRKIVAGVDRWAYLSEKNLEHLRDWPDAKQAAIRVPNGMPRDDRPFQVTRQEMGIEPTDFVLALASRPIKEKGWEAAILAVQAAQAGTKRKLRLLLFGNGPEADELRAKYESDAVRFMGYQDRIVGAFRLADCVLLPTRFEGESFPLCLIEALQAGAPVIATEIGEIPRMLRAGSMCAGELLPLVNNDRTFVASIADAIVRLADDEGLRFAYADAAKQLGERYDINVVASEYARIYAEMIAEYAASAGPAPQHALVPVGAQ